MQAQSMTRNTTTCYCGRRIASASVDPDAHGLGLCSKCLVEAELENEHSDYGHETPVEGCPTCGLAGPEKKTIAPGTKSVSTAEVLGTAKCQVCEQDKPLKQFPTKRDAEGVYVRDARVCRRCKNAGRTAR